MPLTSAHSTAHCYLNNLRVGEENDNCVCLTQVKRFMLCQVFDVHRWLMWECTVERNVDHSSSVFFSTQTLSPPSLQHMHCKVFTSSFIFIFSELPPLHCLAHLTIFKLKNSESRQWAFAYTVWDILYVLTYWLLQQKGNADVTDKIRNLNFNVTQSCTQ